MMIFTGVGDNGKSTAVDTVADILGDYSKLTDTDVITEDKYGKEYYLAELAGSRMVVMSEAEADRHMAKALVKRMLDNKSMVGRSPAGKPFSFPLYFTPILNTNHIPYIGTDRAVWRRIWILEWKYTIPESEKNTSYREKVLIPEYEGIFNWLVHFFPLFMLLLDPVYPDLY